MSVHNKKENVLNFIIIVYSLRKQCLISTWSVSILCNLKFVVTSQVSFIHYSLCNYFYG